MRFTGRYLHAYFRECPIALALERCFECEILSELSFEPPVLDLGCGEGIFAKVLFTTHIDVGIDPDSQELQRARQFGAYRKLIQAQGEELPVKSESFSTVLSNSVLEHIPQLTPVLREVYRVMKPGGTFYVTVPTDQFDRNTVIYQALTRLGLLALAERYRTFFNRFWRHYHYYDLEGWSSLFRDAQFQIQRSQFYDPKRLCMLNDLLAPFALPSFLTKRMLNRWFLFPSLRGIVAGLLSAALRPFVVHDEECEDGGLLFFALRKEASPGVEPSRSV